MSVVWGGVGSTLSAWGEAALIATAAGILTVAAMLSGDAEGGSSGAG